MFVEFATVEIKYLNPPKADKELCFLFPEAFNIFDYAPTARGGGFHFYFKNHKLHKSNFDEIHPQKFEKFAAQIFLSQILF